MPIPSDRQVRLAVLDTVLERVPHLLTDEELTTEITAGITASLSATPCIEPSAISSQAA